MMVYPTAELASAGDRAKSPVVPVAERQLEVPRLAAARRPAARLLPRRLRRRARGSTIPVPVELADARLRHPDLHQHHLSVAAGPNEAAAACPRTSTRSAPTARTFTVPPGVDGPPGVPALRRRRLGLLRLGERREGRLQRGQPHAGRVQHHAAPEARREPAGRGGLPLQRRRVPRRPGHVAHERHLPRRLPVVARRRSTSATSRCSTDLDAGYTRRAR